MRKDELKTFFHKCNTKEKVPAEDSCYSQFWFPSQMTSPVKKGAGLYSTLGLLWVLSYLLLSSTILKTSIKGKSCYYLVYFKNCHIQFWLSPLLSTRAHRFLKRFFKVKVQSFGCLYIMSWWKKERGFEKWNSWTWYVS